jgi:hypothetical protein
MAVSTRSNMAPYIVDSTLPVIHATNMANRKAVANIHSTRLGRMRRVPPDSAAKKPAMSRRLMAPIWEACSAGPS